jgi:uncharacterized membrane protein
MNRVYRVLSGVGVLLGLWLGWVLMNDPTMPAQVAQERFALADAVLKIAFLVVLIWLAAGVFWPRIVQDGTGRVVGAARRVHLLGPLLFSPIPLLGLAIQTHPGLAAQAMGVAGLGLCIVGLVISSILSPGDVRRGQVAIGGWFANRKLSAQQAIAQLSKAPLADWIHGIAVALVLAASIAPRVANLGNILLYDEAVTYLNYTDSPWAALTVYDRPNNHLLHSLLVYFSTQLFGSSEVAIRLPAFLASILGLWAVYRLAARLFNRDVALWALALAGLSPWLMEYSYNARGYTLVVWLLTVALERLVRAFQDGSGFGTFEIALVLAAFAIPTTVYFYAAVGVFAAGLWASRLLLDRGPEAKPLSMSLFAVAGWIGLLYLNPFYWRWLRGLSLYPSDVGLTDLSVLVSYLGRNLFALSTGVIPPLAGMVVILVVFGSAAAWLMRTKPAALALVLCVLLVPLGLVSAQALAGMNIPTPRALVFVAPVIYILASSGIYNLFRELGHRLRRTKKKWTGTQQSLLSALAALFILGLALPQFQRQFTPYDQRANYQDEGYQVKEIAHYLAEVVEPGDGIFLEMCCTSAQVQYYLPHEVAEQHWGISGETQRVFFVPGVWVTMETFQERYGDTFQLVGSTANIGRDTIFMFTRQDAP